MKEVHFFDYLFREDFRKWIGHHINAVLKRELFKLVGDKNKKIDWKRIHYLSELATYPEGVSEGWYKKIFSYAPHGSVRGEITPEYSTIGEDGIKYLLELIPDVKIIYIIRNPVARAWSQLKMNMVRNGSLVKGESVTDEVFVENLNNPSIMDRGNYSVFVPQWDKYFTEGENILYIPFDDIQSEPQRLMSEIEEFLGLPKFSSYEGLSKVVHKGSETSIPGIVDAELQRMMTGEFEYLKTRFSASFNSRV